MLNENAVFDQDDIIENDNTDETVSLKEYSITNYGIDYDVEGLVKRLNRGDIEIPEFQREFVWEQKRSSRFIESLLMGLPVPGIFLYKESESNKLLVIDGQQRLKTLQYFYQGVFGDEENGRVFQLTGLESRFNRKTYETLEPEDKRTLDDSIIHATIIRQDLPDDDGSSKYFVFERLNTGAKPLVAQEIRAAIYSGKFNQLLFRLNQNSHWRQLFGRANNRKRDEELILRFLALYFELNVYAPPMKAFLNTFMIKNRNLQNYSEDQVKSIFEPTVAAILDHIGQEAFRPKNSVNAAVVDSVMIGVAKRLERGSINASIADAYSSLLETPDFLNAISVSTADTDNVRRRIRLAIEAFENVG